MDYFCVKNWDSFQHYKDRNPPWIKLYNELLDDYDFETLPDKSKGHLICIWLLASRLDNKIPHKLPWVTRKIGAVDKVDLDILFETGFLAEWDVDSTNDCNWDSRYVSEKVRNKIIKKYGGKCASCGSKLMIEIDHIIPISKGGTGEEDNLQVLCKSCNRKKHNSLPDKCYGKRSKVLQTEDSKCCTETETETEKSRVESDGHLTVFDDLDSKKTLFEKFMDKYPNSQEPDCAMEEWNNQPAGSQLRIAEAAGEWAAYWERENFQVKFIPKPANFISKGTWKTSPPPRTIRDNDCSECGAAFVQGGHKYREPSGIKTWLCADCRKQAV